MIVVYDIDCAPIFFSFVCSFPSPFSFHLSVFSFQFSPLSFHLSPFSFHLSVFTFQFSPFSFHLSVFSFHLSVFSFHLSELCILHPYYTENGKNRALFFSFFFFFFIFLKRFTIKSDSRLSIQSKNDVNNAFFRIKTCMYSQKILPLQRKLELFTS